MMPFSTIFIAFLVSLLSCLGVMYFFPKWGLMDRPEAYGHQRAAIPYPGGMALAISILIPALLLVPASPRLTAILAGGLLLAIVSFIDDRRGLSPYLRLGVQFIAALSLVLGGVGISSLTNPFGAPIVLDGLQWSLSLGNFTWDFVFFADLFTLFWVMVMVNAFNWIDGVSGMSSGVGVIASAILLLLSMRPDFHAVDQSVAITLSSLVLGASLAFFIFDFPPPRMLLGDTGSMLLGYLIAVIAIVSGAKIATVLLILGLPIVDFAWVILRRIHKKQSPFKGDLWHFHHRLLKAGFSERQVVGVMMGASLCFGVVSLTLQTEGKLWAFIVVVLLMLTAALFLMKRIGKSA